MGIKLGDISPLAGAITGKGLFGKGMAAFEDATGMGGILPKLALAQREKERRKAEEAAAMQNAGAPASGMKKGGKVKKMAKGGSTASKRADGCATKGKTKGRFV
jgi:hypothetical protein